MSEIQKENIERSEGGILKEIFRLMRIKPFLDMPFAKKYQIAVKPLLELLESRPSLMSDERDDLEERICIALGQIGSEEAVPALSAIVGQKKFFVVKPYHKKVQAAAKKAIEEIVASQYK